MKRMRAYEASSSIEASPDRVWQVLAEIAEWPDWDSGVSKVDGRLALGQRLSIAVPANPGRVFPVEVVELSPPERIVFRGGMPLGLFTGRRTYTVAADGSGTRFTMREEYTGLLASAIFKSIPDLSPSFRKFADGLKQQAETPESTVAP